MNEDALRKGIRSGGCRLCLAPDTECVPIFATAAADKEPLSHKILSCVNIKVSDKAANSYYTSMSLSIHPPIYQSLRDSAKSAHIWCVGETRKKRNISKNSVRLIWKCARDTFFTVRATTRRRKKKVKISSWDTIFFSFGRPSIVIPSTWSMALYLCCVAIYVWHVVCVPIRIN